MSNHKESWFDRTWNTAQDLGENASNAASEAGEFLGDITSQVYKASNETVSQISQAVSENLLGSETSEQETALDLSQVSEETRLAFYGALFAIAVADEHLDQTEMELIFGIMDLENMSEDAQRQVQSYIIQPPSLMDCLNKLSDADEKLRYGLMVNLVDTVWADDELDINEEIAILMAQRELGITDEQLEAIKTFIQRMREIRDRGLDDDRAADAIKSAASGLAAVGVPLAAVWFSGSVIGFSAVGITSGLAALGALVGIGGMIPGIGVVILGGAGIFMGLNWLLDTGDDRKKEQIKANNERKAQLVLKNMQRMIDRLTEKITNLQAQAANLKVKSAEAEASKEAVKILTERLMCLKQSAKKRKRDRGAE